MNKKFKFLLIDDYTSIIGILCRSTLDLHSFIVLVLGQMNELFKMAFKRLRQLFELLIGSFFWGDQKLSTHLKMPVYPHIRALKMGNKLAASLMWSMKCEHSTNRKYTISCFKFMVLCKVIRRRPTARGKFLYNIRAPAKEKKISLQIVVQMSFILYY